MKSLKLHPGVAMHAVVREDIFHGILKLYEKQEVTAERPFRVCFSVRAIDFDGVARDLFLAFFEEACEVHFDGSSLLAPVHPTVNMQHLPL